MTSSTSSTRLPLLISERMVLVSLRRWYSRSIRNSRCTEKLGVRKHYSRKIRLCLTIRVSRGEPRSERCKERGGSEPRRGLQTTSDAAARRSSARPSGEGGVSPSPASDLLDDLHEVVCVGLPWIRAHGA